MVSTQYLLFFGAALTMLFFTHEGKRNNNNIYGSLKISFISRPFSRAKKNVECQMMYKVRIGDNLKNY